MQKLINSIHISNFKSIKDISLNECKRVNLLIGKPNVGKSNILEALSLFCLPYLKYGKKKSIQQFIRIENDAELFFNGNIDQSISVKADDMEAKVDIDAKGVNVTLSYSDKEIITLPFSNLLLSTKKNIDDFSTVNPFKSYFYPTIFEKDKVSINYLLPPDGSNLMTVVTQQNELKKELTEIFKEYDLKYVFDTNSQEIKIMKEKGSGEIFLIPFHSIADTLQRMIFYKAAIESNQNSVLIFEEPEAHSYPPYISKITQDIINSEQNQFFITTHSPYVVNDLLEQAEKDLAIYLTDFKDGETIVKRATSSELQEMYEYGADLFFNTETFLK